MPNRHPGRAALHIVFRCVRQPLNPRLPRTGSPTSRQPGNLSKASPPCGQACDSAGNPGVNSAKHFPVQKADGVSAIHAGLMILRFAIQPSDNTTPAVQMAGVVLSFCSELRGPGKRTTSSFPQPGYRCGGVHSEENVLYFYCCINPGCAAAAAKENTG